MPSPDAPPAAPTRLTLLGSTHTADDDDLARLYAYPDAQTPCVRANFIASIDGGATLAGRSGGLAGPGDRTLFMLLRSLADVIVVGAGTVRVENYGGVQLSPAQLRQRQQRGQAGLPRLAVVTKSGNLDPDMRVFTTSQSPPLVATCTAAAATTRERLAGVADVVDCSAEDPERVDEAAVLAAVSAGGHHRVLTEGGPMLLSSFIEADLLDELCLTVAPYLVGGQARRIATGPGQAHTAMHCAHLLTDDAGYLYARYTKNTRR